MEEYKFKNVEVNIYPTINHATAYAHLDHVSDSGYVLNVPVRLYSGKLDVPNHGIHSDIELRAYINGCFVGSMMDLLFYEMKPEHYNEMVMALYNAKIISFKPETI